MKNIFFAALTLATLFATSSSCTKDPISENNSQILVRFHNTMNTKIEASQMEFDSTNLENVGEIAAGATTGYIPFDYFEVGYYPGGDYEFPMGYLNGKKDGVAFTGWSGNWCGTGVEYKQLEPGQYTIEISDSPGDPLGYNSLIRFVE
jgi:hypothetical protein